MIRIINERSTAVFTIEYLDEELQVISPDTSYWQLMKQDGTIMNGRTFANNSFTGTTVVLSGDDLALDATKDIVRIFAIEGTYTSTLGTDLPFTEEIEFNIRNLYSQV